MITRDITSEQLAIAKEKAVAISKLKNSIRNGDGSVAGILGELVAAEYYELTHESTYHYDLIDRSLGTKIDVKTKVTTVTPQAHYNCTVADFNTKQECDYYMFVRVTKDYTKAWILGFLGKEEFYNLATFNKKDEPDPDAPAGSGWTFKADCYNVPISKLRTLELETV